MFNFQKEVVLNSLDKAKFISALETKNGVATVDAKVRFHDGGEYRLNNIVDKTIYVTDAVEGEEFHLSLKLPEDILGQHIQVLIELGLDNDYRGDYGSALWYFRKPILVDVVLPAVGKGTGAVAKAQKEAAKVLHKAIKTAIPAEYQFIKVDDLEENATQVTIHGSDSYQKVRKVLITRYECEERCGADASEEPVEVANLSAGKLEDKDNGYVLYTPNVAQFGTYEYILHNLRMPTSANYRFTSPAAIEMPIKGEKYTQFSFAYCVPRGIHFGGVSVVGQTNRSTTLHTFYVAEKIKAKFIELFSNLEGIQFVGIRGTVVVLPDDEAVKDDLDNKEPETDNDNE